VTILVTGATGTVGRVVVNQLVAAGQQVHALTRNPVSANLPDGVEVVTGDLAKPHQLADVLKGVDRAFYLPEVAELADARVFLELAELRRIVHLSGSAVTVRRPGSHEKLLEFEQAIEASGAEWTHVRPHEFAVNKIDVWAHSVRAENVIRNAYPDGIGVPVHEADIAEIATIALLEDGHAGRAYTVTGPQALTHREQAAAVAEGLGRQIRFEAQTFGQARRAYVEAGMPVEIADYILGYQAEFAEEPPQVSPDFEQVTGRPGRTLAQWANDHRADFS